MDADTVATGKDGNGSAMLATVTSSVRGRSPRIATYDIDGLTESL